MFLLFPWKRLLLLLGWPGVLPTAAQGLPELVAFCEQQGVQLVAMEASGGYERVAFAMLWAAGVPVTLLNPRGVRDLPRVWGCWRRVIESMPE